MHAYQRGTLTVSHELSPHVQQMMGSTAWWPAKIEPCACTTHIEVTQTRRGRGRARPESSSRDSSSKAMQDLMGEQLKHFQCVDACQRQLCEDAQGFRVYTLFLVVCCCWRAKCASKAEQTRRTYYAVLLYK